VADTTCDHALVLEYNTIKTQKYNRKSAEIHIVLLQNTETKTQHRTSA